MEYHEFFMNFKILFSKFAKFVIFRIKKFLKFAFSINSKNYICFAKPSWRAYNESIVVKSIQVK